MGISIKLAASICLVFLASSIVDESQAMVFTSKVALHLGEACLLFAEEVADEGGKCDPDVIEEVIDEVDEIEAPGVDPDVIEGYLEKAEQGKMCYSPDGESVVNLKDGCAAMDAVCTGGENVMYCSQMADVTVTNDKPTDTPKTTRRAERRGYNN